VAAVMVTVAKVHDLDYAWRAVREAFRGAGYYRAATEASEPPGTWVGPGAERVRFAAGEEGSGLLEPALKQLHPVLEQCCPSPEEVGASRDIQGEQRAVSQQDVDRLSEGLVAQGTLAEPLNVGANDTPGAVIISDQKVLRADEDRQPGNPVAEGQPKRQHEQQDHHCGRAVNRRRDQPGEYAAAPEAREDNRIGAQGERQADHGRSVSRRADRRIWHPASIERLGSRPAASRFLARRE